MYIIIIMPSLKYTAAVGTSVFDGNNTFNIVELLKSNVNNFVTSD